MRSKPITLLVLSAVALTGCAASETPAPAPSASTPVPVPSDVVAEPSGSVNNEQAFIEAVESQIAGKEDALEAEMPAKKLSEDYWLERGEVYCDQQAEGETKLPKMKGATEGQFEIILASASISALCPDQ